MTDGPGRRVALKPDWLGSLEPLPWSWATTQLERERNYWLVTAREDGFPQARPVWGLWVDDRLYLSVAGGGLGRTADEATRPATAHVDSAASVVIVEGVLERTTRDGGGTFEIPSDALPKLIDGWNTKYDTTWTLERYGLNFVLRPQVVLAWREGADRTNADASAKWVL